MAFENTIVNINPEGSLQASQTLTSFDRYIPRQKNLFLPFFHSQPSLMYIMQVL
jgi:hypothetical protein